ncbi:MAG TPA: alkaline phosphatase family protein, partial [Gammaproteobacteria bacterium]|nr:alkaline phosphatase family protein [Gammaproteobacteria bacterium]
MPKHDDGRRRFVRDTGLLVGAAASGVLSRAKAQTRAGNRSLHDQPLTRIAFGSCASQDKEQPIWETVLDARPELFIFLGDNIYGDTRDM